MDLHPLAAEFARALPLFTWPERLQERAAFEARWSSDQSLRRFVTTLRLMGVREQIYPTRSRVYLRSSGLFIRAQEAETLDLELIQEALGLRQVVAAPVPDDGL